MHGDPKARSLGLATGIVHLLEYCTWRKLQDLVRRGDMHGSMALDGPLFLVPGLQAG
jgi:hypothetical protein